MQQGHRHTIADYADRGLLIAAILTCLDGKDYIIGQRTPTGHGCWMSSFNYPDKQNAIIYSIPDVCDNDECLGGLKYSTDINSNGPFFYSVTGICKQPSTRRTRLAAVFIAEEDEKNPTYQPTPAFEQGQIESKPYLCWWSMCHSRLL